VGGVGEIVVPRPSASASLTGRRQKDLVVPKPTGLSDIGFNPHRTDAVVVSRRRRRRCRIAVVHHVLGVHGGRGGRRRRGSGGTGCGSGRRGDDDSADAWRAGGVTRACSGSRSRQRRRGRERRGSRGAASGPRRTCSRRVRY
jgi:hypothetical protein